VQRAGPPNLGTTHKYAFAPVSDDDDAVPLDLHLVRDEFAAARRTLGGLAGGGVELAAVTGAGHHVVLGRADGAAPVRAGGAVGLEDALRRLRDHDLVLLHHRAAAHRDVGRLGDLLALDPRHLLRGAVAARRQRRHPAGGRTRSLQRTPALYHRAPVHSNVLPYAKAAIGRSLTFSSVGAPPFALDFAPGCGEAVRNGAARSSSVHTAKEDA